MFGWLINRPVTDRLEKSVHLSVLSIQCEKGEDKLLFEQIGKFWDLDLVGIKDEGQSRDDTIGNISFEKGRYEVELPFRAIHPPLADNYTLSKKR